MAGPRSWWCAEPGAALAFAAVSPQVLWHLSEHVLSFFQSALSAHFEPGVLLFKHVSHGPSAEHSSCSSQHELSMQVAHSLAVRLKPHFGTDAQISSPTHSAVHARLQVHAEAARKGPSPSGNSAAQSATEC